MKWLAFAVLLFAAPASSAAEDTYPQSSILLFVASWCAPCHAELARLPAISRGARPFRVLVVPYDETAATRAMIQAVPSAQRWRPSRPMRRRIERELMGQTAGLPFGVAINRDGAACGTVRKGLDARTAEALVAGCLRR